MAVQQQVLRARDGRAVQSPHQLAGLIEKIGDASIGLSHEASILFRGILVRFHRIPAYHADPSTPCETVILAWNWSLGPDVVLFVQPFCILLCF
jgi:phage tail protein X